MSYFYERTKQCMLQMIFPYIVRRLSLFINLDCLFYTCNKMAVLVFFLIIDFATF